MYEVKFGFRHLEPELVKSKKLQEISYLAYIENLEIINVLSCTTLIRNPQ